MVMRGKTRLGRSRCVTGWYLGSYWPVSILATWTSHRRWKKLARLTDAGVSAFIDLTEEDEGLKPYAYLLNGPSHKRFAIPDQRVPTTDELTMTALDAIDRYLEAGETLYVHCWGGVGRTGTIIGCWLSRRYEPGQPALDRLRELWKKNPQIGLETFAREQSAGQLRAGMG